MGRKPRILKTQSLPLTLTEQTLRRLEGLVKTGGYGNNPTDAARIIVMRHLQDLDDRGKINIFDGGEGSTDTTTD